MNKIIKKFLDFLRCADKTAHSKLLGQTVDKAILNITDWQKIENNTDFETFMFWGEAGNLVILFNRSHEYYSIDVIHNDQHEQFGTVGIGGEILINADNAKKILKHIKNCFNQKRE